MSHLHADQNVYDSLAEAAGGEERWAFGTGFHDTLAGIDPSVPDSVDAPALARECLGLADDALVLSQRLGLWVSNAHELEDEVALANIALDLLGQARMLLSRAAQADPALRPADAPGHVPDEDALAYWRDAAQFTNVTAAELDDGRDFARCVARLLAVTTWRLAIMSRLSTSAPDPVLAAIATKAIPELSYHREYAVGWTIRLGDGTDYSHARMQAAIDWVSPYLVELFAAEAATGEEVTGVLATVLAEASLATPQPAASATASGRSGVHTEDLTALLADLQSVARAHPEATW